MTKTSPCKPVCRDVLDPDFDRLNEPAGYDPTYNYVGSDYLKRKFGIALKRNFCGKDINPAAWLHDIDFGEKQKSRADFRRDNRTFRQNIARILASEPDPHYFAAWFLSWFHWLGVSNVFAWIDYWTCK